MDVVTPPDEKPKRTFDEYFNDIKQRVASWKKDELEKRCNSLRIHGKNLGVLRGKLKHTYKQQARLIHQKMASVPPPVFTYFDYLVVIDFEATCVENGPPNFRHEIIQFPAVLVDVRRQIIVDKFCVFVKPTVNPILSEFCTKLTGITQEQVDNAPDFVEALSMFKTWLKSHHLGTVYKYAIVTDSQCDMGRFLYMQCEISKIPYIQEAFYWVNLRECFRSFYGVKWVSLRMVLDVLGQPFIGRPHNGLDDAITISSILLRLLRDGCVVVLNEKIVLKKAEQDRLAKDIKKSDCYTLSTVQAVSRNDFLSVYNHMNLQRQQAKKFAETVQTSEINSNKENSWPVNFHPRKKLVANNKRHMKKQTTCIEVSIETTDEIPVVSYGSVQEE